MSEDKQVWVIGSEEIENKIRSALSQIPEARIVGFRNVSHAVDALRKGHKPRLILGNHYAADAILEVAHQKSKYAGIKTAYVSEHDLSLFAQAHEADYVKVDKNGNPDGLADYARKQLE